MPMLAVIAVLVLQPAGQAAGLTAAPPRQAGLHDGHGAETPTGAGHDAPQGASADEPGHYFTLNVTIGDEGIQPSALFIPAGRRVQLLLRTRSVAEHHYRVVGLVPDRLAWIADHDSGAGEDSSEEHHHARAYVSSRETSPAGITSTGREVHAYVTPARGVDVVVFTATNTGTFEVKCDLHQETLGKVTVFGAGTPTASAPPVSVAGGALARALTRDLGSTGAGVRAEATYVPSEYAAQVLGSGDMAGQKPGRYVAMLLTELVHTGDLPGTMEAPELWVSGERLPLVDTRVMATSVHHRATVYRFAPDDGFGQGHQGMTLRLASGQEATWHLPVIVPGAVEGAGMPVGFGQSWGLILALLAGMVGAMWPCLFQLTVYFIPALAGIAMQETGEVSKQSRRRQVLRAAFFFILGFTLVYTATGALIGYAAQRFSDTSQLEVWQRYFGIAAGLVVIALALRVAVKVRAPLVCRMPVLSWMSRSNKAAGPLEMMLAGLAFATSCMTCFGSALVVVMVVYIGLAQSAFYGALVLFLFSLGMGIPLVIAAVAMAQALPFLLRLEAAVPWMGLASAVLMVGFGVLLISGNYMVVSDWTYRIVGGAALAPTVGGELLLVSAMAGGLGLLGWLVWLAANGKAKRPGSMDLSTP